MIALASSNLSKAYRSGPFGRSAVTALDSLSLEVESGQIFSLLGPNGAGKTTFIKILLSLVHPTGGQAVLLGHPLPNRAARGRIGYLPENHRFPGHLTPDQVLWLFGGLAGVRGGLARKRADELLQLVGIGQWRGMRVRKFSKGMMQRLGLAQALVNDPDLLFLDEPTDGVDPVGRKEIREVLKRLRDQGKTIFLNSHLLSEVELISDRVAVLDRGKLLRTGTVEELTTAESRYQIGIAGRIPDRFRAEAEAQVFSLSYDAGGITADVRSTADLNRLIDLLRSNHVEITSVSRQRSSLEESFINLIKREVPS